METIIFKIGGVIFRMVGILLIAGTMLTVMIDIQRRAFDSHRIGLVRMLDINRQLVGRTK